MKNVKTEVKGDNLIITVNLKETHGISGSGKSEIIASTEGNIDVNGVKVGLNVYKPVSK